LKGCKKHIFAMKKRSFVRKIPAFFLFFIVTSCLNQADCFTASNLVKVNLKKLSDNSAAMIAFNTITVSGTSFVIYSNTATTTLNLPVNPETTETTFLFNYNEVVAGVTTIKTSTLTLSYVNETRLISEECGAFQYQKDLAVGSTDFVKTKIIDASLLTKVYSNLEIYF
jgi:hypothetical protein